MEHFLTGMGNTASCDDCPQEGATRPEMVGVPRGGMAPHKTRKQYYHSGGLNGSEAGWYSQEKYAGILEGIATEMSYGFVSAGSMEWFNNNANDELSVMLAAYATSIGNARERHRRFMASGYAQPMGFDSPFFAPGVALKLLQSSKVSRFAFWSGKGTQQATINAGYRVIGQTRAGQNLAALTADMVYKPGSQAYNFWGRLSSALARTVPKGGTANVFLTKSAVNNPTSIWNVFEKPILLQNKVKIKYNWVD